MPALELWLIGLLVVGLLLAAYSLRNGRAAGRWTMPLITLIFLSGSALFAAAHQAEMLVYLGLAAGGFLAAMLWEGPHPRRESSSQVRRQVFELAPVELPSPQASLRACAVANTAPLTSSPSHFFALW